MIGKFSLRNLLENCSVALISTSYDEDDETTSYLFQVRIDGKFFYGALGRNRFIVDVTAHNDEMISYRQASQIPSSRMLWSIVGRSLSKDELECFIREMFRAAYRFAKENGYLKYNNIIVNTKALYEVQAL